MMHESKNLNLGLKVGCYWYKDDSYWTCVCCWKWL